MAHSLSDREVNLDQPYKTLVNVFGEPGLEGLGMTLEITEAYWDQVCRDLSWWNVNKYHF